MSGQIDDHTPRLVTRDDEAQAQRAKAAFDAHAGEHGGLFIADIVLAELCWTLARAYRLARTDIARTVRVLLDNSSIAFESQGAGRAALAGFEARAEAHGSGIEKKSVKGLETAAHWSRSLEAPRTQAIGEK